MPPKRKQRDDIVSGSESDAVPPRRPTATTLLPEVMQNIEKLKIKRDSSRKKITMGFDAYVNELKKRIEVHCTAEAKKRSTEAKALLARYIEALEKQASIERSIELIVLNSNEDLKGLGMVLEAAFSGRQQQSRAAVGSFTPDEPMSAEGTVPKPHGNADKSISGVQGDVSINGVRKEGYGDNGCAHDDREAGGQGGSIFDRISW